MAINEGQSCDGGGAGPAVRTLKLGHKYLLGRGRGVRRNFEQFLNKNKIKKISPYRINLQET